MGGIFVGEKGKIEINRNRLASNPPELVENAPPPADKSEYASVSHEHIRNWVSCMRTREKPVAPADGRPPRHDDLPLDQHLPRVGTHAALGSRPRGIRGR